MKKPGMIFPAFLLLSMIHGQELRLPDSGNVIEPVMRKWITGVEKSVLKREHQLLLAGFSAAAGLAFLADGDIEDFMAKTQPLPTGLADAGNFSGGYAAPFIAYGTIILSGLGENLSFQDIYPDLEMVTGAFLVNAMAVYSLKYLTGRERPDGSNNRSFPSGHAANGFLMASLIEKRYGMKTGIPFYGLAGIIALSRLQHEKHYAADVIMGAGIGFTIGRGFSSAYQRGRYKMSVSPYTVTDERGTETGIQFRLGL